MDKKIVRVKIWGFSAQDLSFQDDALQEWDQSTLTRLM